MKTSSLHQQKIVPMVVCEHFSALQSVVHQLPGITLNLAATIHSPFSYTHCYPFSLTSLREESPDIKRHRVSHSHQHRDVALRVNYATVAQHAENCCRVQSLSSQCRHVCQNPHSNTEYVFHFFLHHVSFSVLIPDGCLWTVQLIWAIWCSHITWSQHGQKSAGDGTRVWTVPAGHDAASILCHRREGSCVSLWFVMVWVFLGVPVADSGCAEDNEDVPESKEGWHIIKMDGRQVRICTLVINKKCQAFETLVIYCSMLSACFMLYLQRSLEMVLWSLRFILHNCMCEACAMYVPWHLYQNWNQCMS